ncbi:chromosome condensation protein [Niveomyces insectorum RCEF 264]|uniref:Chromosome condensation protein n=1 Tax=Niveomyces insectorum RCEF 264 TaxID=1081102 RepID=A0A167WFH5_9HYPO|nr:chromosome condensation protein [Niveomyces insectorum RCEF 264]
MPAAEDADFYRMLDSIAETTRDENAIQQNKRIKEALVAEDSREPTEKEVEAIRKELQKEKKHSSTNVDMKLILTVNKPSNGSAYHTADEIVGSVGLQLAHSLEIPDVHIIFQGRTTKVSLRPGMDMITQIGESNWREETCKLFTLSTVVRPSRVTASEKENSCYRTDCTASFSFRFPQHAQCCGLPAKPACRLPPSTSISLPALKVTVTYSVVAVCRRPRLFARKLRARQLVHLALPDSDRPPPPASLVLLDVGGDDGQGQNLKLARSTAWLPSSTLKSVKRHILLPGCLPPYSPAMRLEAVMPHPPQITPGQALSLGLFIHTSRPFLDEIGWVQLRSLTVRLRQQTVARVGASMRSDNKYWLVWSVKGTLPIRREKVDVSCWHDLVCIPASIQPGFRSCFASRQYSIEVTMGVSSKSEPEIQPLNAPRLSRAPNLTGRAVAPEGSHHNHIHNHNRDGAGAYDSPGLFARLTEVSAPAPVENTLESPVFMHNDIESRTGYPQRRHRSHESALDRVRSSRRGGQEHNEMAPQNPQQRVHHTGSRGLDLDYDVPLDFGDLNEIRGPPPLENPDELPIARHHSLEERVVGRRRSWSGTKNAKEGAAEEREPAALRAAPKEQPAEGRRAPRNARVSRLLTEVYTIAHLIFFSILGTLARLGLNTLTTYTGAPASFGVLWSNFAGTAVLGFLAELAPLIHRHVVSAVDDDKSSESPSEHNNSSSNSSNSGNSSNGGGGGGGGSPSVSPAWKRQPIPLYIGLATGFCGSITSFSSFMLDVFEALSNTLPAPQYHSNDGNGGEKTFIASRGAGADVRALLAVLLLTICMCLSALKLGAHVALAVRRCCGWLSPRVLSILDNGAVVLGLGAWVAAVLLAVFPPDRMAAATSGKAETWRGDVLFALVFAPLGCLLRFYTSLKLNAVFVTFPLGTFVVNILGTAVLGMAWDLQHAPASVTGGSRVGCQVLQGVMDGFCGCLTTVSTWMTELSGLRRAHAFAGKKRPSGGQRGSVRAATAVRPRVSATRGGRVGDAPAAKWRVSTTNTTGDGGASGGGA